MKGPLAKLSLQYEKLSLRKLKLTLTKFQLSQTKFRLFARHCATTSCAAGKTSSDAVEHGGNERVDAVLVAGVGLSGHPVGDNHTDGESAMAHEA